CMDAGDYRRAYCVFYQGGRYEQAAEMVDKLLSLYPAQHTDKDYRYAIQVYTKLGNVRKTVYLMGELFEKYPDKIGERDYENAENLIKTCDQFITEQHREEVNTYKGKKEYKKVLQFIQDRLNHHSGG